MEIIDKEEKVYRQKQAKKSDLEVYFEGPIMRGCNLETRIRIFYRDRYE